MEEKELRQYILPLEQTAVILDCKEAFSGLTEKEKLYAYYLSRASWDGGLIALVQTSPESPAIFAILHDLFKSNGIEDLKTLAIRECEFTEDEWKAFLIYTCQVFKDMGNYKGYGDTKVIPGVPVDKVEALLTKGRYNGHETTEIVLEKWKEIKDKVYSLSERERQLGLGEKGISTYFSLNCTFEDAERINRFMKKHGMEAFITRCFKTVVGGIVTYEIRSASSKTDEEICKEKVYSFEDCSVVLTRGDYAPLMEKVVQNLLLAREHASNETEQKMLDCYVDSFTEGSLDAHKNGSRYWVKNQGPIVETYIGFIETYRDPQGCRGEFRGFVSVVNRQMSAKFASLVDQATQLLPLLPWPKEFEKDKFLKPDFTSLDVVAFSGTKVPAGTNVPNYDEICQLEGFKNLSLGNVVSSSFQDRKVSFVNDEDRDILLQYLAKSFEVQVGLHELLGHGSGKLFRKEEDGKTNYSSDLRNPVTNELIESAYEPGETFDSVFTTMKSAYEECRAECVGYLLSLDKDVVKIFGHEGKEAEDVIYTNWLSAVLAGVKSLQMYQSKTQTWMQAHSHGNFVILQVLLEAGEDFVSVEETVGSDGKPDLIVKLDRTKLQTVGRKAMSEFLLKLQVYKSSADIKSAKEMFDKYSAVNNEGRFPWAKWRDIVIDKKKPPRIMIQPNLFIHDDGSVHLKMYEPTCEGCIESWIERFSDLSIYKDLEHCRQKDKPFFQETD